MSEIEFFWTRACFCLAGTALITVLFWLTCGRSACPKNERRPKEVSCHFTPRGPAL